MDDELLIFYRTLDPGKFKYFCIDKLFYVFNSDVDFLPNELRDKAVASKVLNVPCRTVKLSEIESVVKELLMKRKVSVEEYEGMKLCRSGYPYNYNDFGEMLLSDEIVPTTGSLARVNKDKIEFGYVRDNTIYYTEYMDDDLYSITYSLINTYNCVEILYGEPELERRFHEWGVGCTLVKVKGEMTSISLIVNFFQKNFNTEKFLVNDICLIDIRQFDLVDFGCTTSQGRRLLKQWVGSPSTSLDEINKRLDFTEAFSDINILLDDFSDLKRLALKITSFKITVNETIKLYQTIMEIPQITRLLHGYCEKVSKHSYRNKMSIQDDLMKKNGFDEEDLVIDGFISKKSDQYCNFISLENNSNKSNIRNDFYHVEKIKNNFLIPLENLCKIFEPLCVEIFKKIDMDTCRIRNTVDDELYSLVCRRELVYSEIEEEFERVRKNYPRVKFQNNFFKISRVEYKEDIFKKQGYSCISILKTGVFFITKVLKEKREVLDKIDRNIQEIENKIFGNLKQEMTKYIKFIEIYNFLIALIDIYKAFGVKKRLSNYSRPIFSENEYKIKSFFHPLLEHTGYVTNDINFTACSTIYENCDVKADCIDFDCKTASDADYTGDLITNLNSSVKGNHSIDNDHLINDNEHSINDNAINYKEICKDSFNHINSENIDYETKRIKNEIINHSNQKNSKTDVNIDNINVIKNSKDILTNTRKKKNVCVLTGPNMGGKSTLLKSLSMVSLYAQIGCYVPATSAVLPIFDRIFMRIGAKDYSSQGLSTYMVEMLDLKKILCTATQRSLVLIDELGRGTSAIDGLSLVLAVKEYLNELGPWTIMATHFSEVGDDSTFNIKMQASETLLTYKIATGICDSSFAINVAKLANFPDSVIQNTKKYLEKL